MAEFWVEDTSLQEFREIRDALVSSPLLGDSPLSGTFRASRGLAFTATCQGLRTLLQRHPVLSPYLSRVLRGRVRSELFGSLSWRRVLAPNVFYLNLLAVPSGADIGPHVDATLRPLSGGADAVPAYVSVLHLTDSGGALFLSRGSRPIAQLRPQAGRMIHFRGDLVHAVAASDDASIRLSLVCEHYRFKRRVLTQLLPLKTHSRAGFDGFLEAERNAQAYSSRPS